MNTPDIREAAHTLNGFKDPFQKSCITNVSTYAYQGFRNEWNYTGKIAFKNGDTGGEQRFTGVSMADVLRKMEKFAKSL